MDITTTTGETIRVTFKWDMKPDRFAEAFLPLPCDDTDYYGAVFFGNFKLEFIRNDTPGGYRNVFQYGAEDGEPGTAYSYLEDDTPYEERCDFADAIEVPYRRTFEAFASAIEKQICDLLLRNPEYIRAATAPTDIAKWYPKRQSRLIMPVTRTA